VEEWLKSILGRIAEGSLFPAAYFAELDCDAALDSRHSDPEFKASWVRLSKEIEGRWKGATIADGLRALANDIRRESFLAVSRATAQHEIASYVSDDFELVVRGRLLGLNDPLLDQVWHAHDQGTFPSPQLAEQCNTVTATDDAQPDYRVESFVSTDHAWHQELRFDSPCKVRVCVENLGGGPLYGFYVDEADFRPLRSGEVTDEILDRVSRQKLFENEAGQRQLDFQFPAGKIYLCVELDCESAPNAKRAEFRLTMTTLE
jgi:hypothetical protein